MSYWLKTKNQDVGNILLSWRHRSVSRMFIRILTWLLTAFVFALLLAIILAPFDPNDTVQPYVRIFFFLILVYGIISSFWSNVYEGQEYAVSDKALLSKQSLWKGGFIMYLLRKKIMQSNKYTEHIPWEQISSTSKTDKHLQLNFKEGGNITVGVIPVLDLIRMKEDSQASGRVTRTIHGFWDRITKVDEKLDKDALKLIVEKTQSAITLLRQESGAKQKRK